MLTDSDSRAFMDMFQPAAEEIYRIAYLYLRNREDARDVVQETAYRCFKSYDRLKHPENFRTWAVKTAINCSLDMLKERKRTVPADEALLKDQLTPSPESGTESRILLEKLMNMLNEREKSVILLKHLYGLELKEIAAALKLPLGTVKSTLYRAINKLEKESGYER